MVVWVVLKEEVAPGTFLENSTTVGKIRRSRTVGGAVLEGRGGGEDTQVLGGGGRREER